MMNQKEINDPNFSWTWRSSSKRLETKTVKHKSNGQVEHSIHFSYDD
jgi:hypothetical protein